MNLLRLCGILTLIMMVSWICLIKLNFVALANAETSQSICKNRCVTIVGDIAANTSYDAKKNCKAEDKIKSENSECWGGVN